MFCRKPISAFRRVQIEKKSTNRSLSFSDTLYSLGWVISQAPQPHPWYLRPFHGDPTITYISTVVRIQYGQLSEKKMFTGTTRKLNGGWLGVGVWVEALISTVVSKSGFCKRIINSCRVVTTANTFCKLLWTFIYV